MFDDRQKFVLIRIGYLDQIMEKMKYTTQLIDHGSKYYQAEVKLREGILRKPLGLSFSKAELLAEGNSIHLGSFDGDKLLACLVLKPLNSDQIQMRQVAVDPYLQGQGLGKALVEYSEKYAKKHNYKQMLLHARGAAVPFYEKLGYLKKGDCFLEVTIPHWEMFKELA